MSPVGKLFQGMLQQNRSSNRDDAPIISRRWFKHLAPAELHPYHSAFDRGYREWLGRELAWERETGRRFKLSPMQLVDAILKRECVHVPVGDPVPLIEMLIEVLPDGSQNLKILPRWQQRTVAEDSVFSKGRDLVSAADAGYLSSPPTILMEVSRIDPIRKRFIGTRRVFLCPAHLLIKPRIWAEPAPLPFTIYSHTFGDANAEDVPRWTYYGVTQRSWQARWAEHRRAMDRGHPYRFYRIFREEFASGRANCVGHEVVDVVNSLEEMYEREEELVAASWGDPYLLNMIPGGRAGIAHMQRHGMLGPRSRPLPHQRDRALEDWVLKNPDLPAPPAPWVSERWSTDPAWAAKFICSSPGRLTQLQVRMIRDLAAQGQSENDILQLSGARTLAQVRGVISGQHYSRVL